MKNQNTVPGDGSFTGHSWQTVTTTGDAGTSTTQGHMGYQSDNSYPQYCTAQAASAMKNQYTGGGWQGKRQLTQQGWDGSFVGIKIPSPTTTDGDAGGSQLGSFQSVDFEGFNRQNEASGPAGPDFSPNSSAPTSGPFPGVGDAGKGGFGSRG